MGAARRHPGRAGVAHLGSPFHHVTQVPLVAADLRGTAVMLAIAAAAAAAAIDRFARRDLQPG